MTAVTSVTFPLTGSGDATALAAVKAIATFNYQGFFGYSDPASGALGAANDAVTIALDGARGLTWEIDTGTLVGTVVFEATLDDTNWFAVNAIRIDGSIVSSITMLWHSEAIQYLLDCVI